jgi:Ankyrin repeats (3 copies)/Ankyrin repeat
VAWALGTVLKRLGLEDGGRMLGERLDVADAYGWFVGVPRSEPTECVTRWPGRPSGSLGGTGGYRGARGAPRRASSGAPGWARERALARRAGRVQQRRSNVETPTVPFGRPSLTMPTPLALFDRIAAGDVAGCAATLAQGGSWDVTDDDGTTPLESAVRAGNVDITRLLLDAGAPPNSAMFVALWSCNDRTPETAAPVIEALLQAGADANWRDDGGRSALHQGVKHAPLVRALLAHGAAPNSATSAGESPLSFACDWGLLESVELLLDAGADPRQAMPELD